MVVGSPAALWEDPCWKELLAFAASNGRFLGAPFPPAQRLMGNAAAAGAGATAASVVDAIAGMNLLGGGLAESMWGSDVGEVAWKVMLNT